MPFSISSPAIGASVRPAGPLYMGNLKSSGRLDAFQNLQSALRTARQGERHFGTAEASTLRRLS
jgi:tRNA G26 N,N-dimethylase Trm1